MRLHGISKQLNSSLDARILVKHVTGLSDSDLITLDEIPLTDVQYSQLENCIKQRLNNRPVAKIIGYKEFYGRNFIVSDDVLDPRPDSETLIEVVLEFAKQKETPLKILDLGTGSGCLILTLLAELENTTAVATDISIKALSIAKQNADKLELSNRIEFIESNWFESITGTFDIIISNPPYINTNVIGDLSKDVQDFDPMQALDGGDDGLNPYKVILPQIRKYLNKGGLLAVEHGSDQCGRIKAIIENEGLEHISMFKDLGGHDRIITAIHK